MDPGPEGDVDLRATPGYKGDTQVGLNAALIAVTTLVVGLRLYARLYMLRKGGLDDVFAVLAFACAVALSAMEIKSASAETPGLAPRLADSPRSGAVRQRDADRVRSSTSVFRLLPGMSRPDRIPRAAAV